MQRLFHLRPEVAVGLEKGEKRAPWASSSDVSPGEMPAHTWAWSSVLHPGKEPARPAPLQLISSAGSCFLGSGGRPSTARATACRLRTFPIGPVLTWD